MSESDFFFMREALKEAVCASEKGEVPVGAVLVHDGKIIARAHNRVEELKEAMAHAELLCLRAAAGLLGNWRLLHSTLYCTLEPCAMCAGAAIASRVGTLVWGARDKRQGANGSWVDLFSLPHPIHTLAIRSGVLQEESASLMREFFRERRREKGSGSAV